MDGVFYYYAVLSNIFERSSIIEKCFQLYGKAFENFLSDNILIGKNWKIQSIIS